MYDIAIIGAGIVGLATAWRLAERHPGRRLVVVDKESRVAAHQTSHNSGVIHAGIYYAPGSLKADFCRRGATATIDFCRRHGIPFEQCGKLVVATNRDEHERMIALHERARNLGIEISLLDAAGLKRREPAINGVGAIHVADTGIVDWAVVAAAMAERFRDAGGEVRLGAAVTAVDERDDAVNLQLFGGQRLRARHVVACGGLMSDRIARAMGLDIDFRIVPYRGEYYRLPASKSGIVSHLIYPVPDPALPFLGVHLTRMIDGSVTVGPNAVQGFKREGYGRLNFSARDTLEMLTFPGFWRVTAAHAGTGLRELRDSVWKRGYLAAVRKYCPSIELGDLLPHPAGIRAQAVLRDGTIVHDFLFAESPRSLHVCNAPSPAATSSIPIGNYIVDKLEEKIEHA